MTKSDNEIKKDIAIVWDSSKIPFTVNHSVEFDILETSNTENYIFENYKTIIILCENKTKKGKVSGNFGFELAKNLRLHKKYKGVVCLCSFSEEFDEKTYPLSKIINTPGTYYIQLPVKNIDIANFSGIDDDELLDDINLSLFDPVQTMHNLIHDLDNVLPQKASELKDKVILKKELTKTLNEYFDLFRVNIIETKVVEYNELVDRLIADILKTIESIDFEPQKLREPINVYKEQLYTYLNKPLSEEDIKQGVDPEKRMKRWEVLYIDDIKSDRDTIQSLFESAGINCYTVTDADSAYEILKNDEIVTEKEILVKGEKKKLKKLARNRISVVISDFRLYKDGDIRKGKWQDTQGYQILKKILHSPDFKSVYALVVLTSKKGTITEKVKSRTNYQWFNKTDVLGGGEHSFNVFIQQIEKLGSDAFFRKHTIPDLDIWTKGYTGRIDFGYYYYYRLHIESVDYDWSEQKINEKAQESIKEILKNGKLSQKLNYQISLLSKKFGNNLELSDNTESLLSKFRESILLARRIVWGIYCYGYTWEEIKEAMLFNSATKTFYNTVLGISRIDDNKRKGLFRYKLLIEEQDFIEQLNNTKIETSKFRIANQDVDLFEEFFDYLSACNILLLSVPKLKTIIDKIEAGAKISFDDLKKMIRPIQRELEKYNSQHKLFIEYREKTAPFFIHSFSLLSDEYKKLLGTINYES